MHWKGHGLSKQLAVVELHVCRKESWCDLSAFGVLGFSRAQRIKTEKQAFDNELTCELA